MGTRALRHGALLAAFVVLAAVVPAGAASPAVSPIGPLIGRTAAAASDRNANQRAVATVRTVPPSCQGAGTSIAQADELMANRYAIAPHPPVVLPDDPTWAEDPFDDANWLFRFHSLGFVKTLLWAWRETGQQPYLDRAMFLLRDWSNDNPRARPASAWSWNDHATAQRAGVYVCAAGLTDPDLAIVIELGRHGQTLADPAFYAGRGNHALNQDIGLLEIGCLLGRDDWKTLAARRINELIRLSVDRQGVTNEQAVYYQLFNYQRYTYARQRLTDCGQPQGPEFDRLAKMPAFLAHATQPDGTYPMLGDTQRMGAAPIAGTTAEFAATLGRSGPKPASTVATYEMGFAFARTGWGEARPFSDETMLSVRFGRARQIHGHHDGSSITLYGHGSPLIVDPGLYAYHGGPYRDYFVGRAAHNLVVADRSTPIRSAPTRRSWTRISKTMYAIAVRSQPYVGVTARRTVALSRSLGYVVVDDRLVSSKRRTYRQLWHLLDGSRPTTSGDRTWTRRDRGNVLIVQLGRPAPTRLVTGSTRPIQGWLSPRYRSLVPAPVVEIRRSASVGRFLTLLVPYATTRPEVIVTGLRMTKTGFSMTITVDGRRERVVMSATGSSITPID